MTIHVWQCEECGALSANPNQFPFSIACDHLRVYEGYYVRADDVIDETCEDFGTDEMRCELRIPSPAPLSGPGMVDVDQSAGPTPEENAFYGMARQLRYYGDPESWRAMGYAGLAPVSYDRGLGARNALLRFVPADREKTDDAVTDDIDKAQQLEKRIAFLEEKCRDANDTIRFLVAQHESSEERGARAYLELQEHLDREARNR